MTLRQEAVMKDIFLEPQRLELPRADSGTVSARELQSDVQEKSIELQQQAAVELRSGRYEEAEKLLRRALELTPSSGAICNNIGLTYLRRHNIDEAAPWFERAVERAPYSAQTVGNLGLLRWIQGRREESFRLLDRATASGFDSPMARYLLGILYLQKMRPRDALEQLKQSSSERLPYRDLYLSVAYAQVGDEKAARKSYHEYVRKNPAPLILARTATGAVR
jgi:tetratricopeptide (TPR) repeat protein